MKVPLYTAGKAVLRGKAWVWVSIAKQRLQLTLPSGTVVDHATLGGGGLVPTSQLGSGTPTGSKFLRDDQVWAVPGGGGGSPDYLTFAGQSTDPGGTTLWMDDGTNYEANTMVWAYPAVFSGEVSIGNPGTEQGSIQYNGAAYDAILKINTIGGSWDADVVVHRHSTTAAATLGFARSKSNTSAHGNVANGDSLGMVNFAGWYTSSYYAGARIAAEVSGTPGAGDMPTDLVFSTSSDGSSSPTERLRIGQGGLTLATALSAANGGTGQSSYTAGDLLYATGGSALGKLAVGSATQVLGISGGAPAWVAADTVVSDAAGANGLVTRTSAGAVTARTLTAGTGVTITNGDGVSGNPTISSSGGTNTDLDPTLGYMVDVQPAGATVSSRDATLTVRSASAAGNTATLRRTKFTGSGVAMDWYFTCNVRLNMSFTFKVRLSTGASIAATCRYKIGLGVGGFTTTDVETATSYILIRASTVLGDTTWKVVTYNGTTATTTDTTVAFAAATEYLFAITTSPSSITVTINGVDTVITATLPAASTDLTLCQCGLLGSTSAREWFFVGARLLVTYP